MASTPLIGPDVDTFVFKSSQALLIATAASLPWPIIVRLPPAAVAPCSACWNTCLICSWLMSYSRNRTPNL